MNIFIYRDMKIDNNILRDLQDLSHQKISEVLLDFALFLESNIEEIIVQNKGDLDLMDSENPKYDRLLLNEMRLKSMILDVQKIAHSKFYAHSIIEERAMSSGIFLQKIRVPIGVIGMIYESRPNVTIDAISLCFKSQNAVILKGSSDAHHSNTIIVAIFHSVLKLHGIATDIVKLLPPERSHALELLKAKDAVDLIIPRGSKSLIDFVRENASVPVIETGAGVVHIYLDKNADIRKASDVIWNSKMRRFSVCNALDCLIIHKDILIQSRDIISKLVQNSIEIFCDEVSFVQFRDISNDFIKPAKQEHYGEEFLSGKLLVCVAQSFDWAVSLIQKYSSKHTDCIITEDLNLAEKFAKIIDSACVFHNVSTGFADGSEFGLESEIGISTQKLHVRGPFSLEALTTTKWLAKGDYTLR
jgi:glutamate-5-semialdehyde dehydrogenase